MNDGILTTYDSGRERRLRAVKTWMDALGAHGVPCEAPKHLGEPIVIRGPKGTIKIAAAASRWILTVGTHRVATTGSISEFLVAYGFKISDLKLKPAA
jgi:hypothetical protein